MRLTKKPQLNLATLRAMVDHVTLSVVLCHTVLHLGTGVLYLGMSDDREHPSVEAATAAEDDLEIMDLFDEDTKKSLNDGFLSHFLPEVTRLQESFHELT